MELVVMRGRNLFDEAGNGLFPDWNELSDEMAQLVKQAAAPARIGERTGTQQQRAAHRLNRPLNWVRKHWYQNRKNIDAYELLRTRAIVAQLAERRARRAALLAETEREIPPLRRKEAGPLERMARKAGLDED